MKKIYLMLAFMLVSVAMSAATYKGAMYQGSGSNYWTSLPYDENGEVAMKVRVSDDKSTVTLLNWTGDAGVDLALTLSSDGTIAQMNGKDPDSYGSQWLGIGSLYDGTYSGVYGYYPTNSLVTINEDGSGEGYFQVYSYNEDGGWKYIYFKWSNETVEDITETVYDGIISEGDTSSEDFDSWTALPYNENGEYAVKIGVASDLSYITIYNWTGETDAANAVDAKLMLDSEGNVKTINGYQDAGWGLETGTIEDDGFYCVYPYPSYSYVEFTADNGSEGGGYFYIYSFATPGYKSVNFSWPAELTPTAIKSVDANSANVIAPAYNAVGQRVNSNTKGLVIRGGKKYINK